MARTGEALVRERLPATRAGKTHKITIEESNGGGELDLYVTTGEYESGRLGEVFVSAGKQGSTLQGMLDGWATVVSIALQHGVALELLADKFVGSSFPPQGQASDGQLATSLYDAVMRWLLKEYGR